MTPEETQKWLSGFDNPNTEQQIKLLTLNAEFMGDTTNLKTKWSNFIKKHNNLINELFKQVMKLQNKFLTDKILPSETELAELKSLGKSQEELFNNIKFNQDLFSLCRKYKLYPIKFWQYSLTFFLVINDFSPPNYWPGLGLKDYSSAKEMIKLPRDLNFDLLINVNKETKEPELFIHIFERTIIEDIKSHWKVIMAYQAKLKQVKKPGKRPYPQKALNQYEALVQLDKTNLSDWEKQERIYGEIPGTDFGPKEIKRRNNIENLRYRHKKENKII